MLKPKIEAILLDIEGTTSSFSFVHDVLLPYAKGHVHSYLAEHLNSEEVWIAIALMAKDLGFFSAEEWLYFGDSEDPVRRIETQVQKWIDADEKLTGLKELQGLIWKEGFARGELKSHVFEDVPACFNSWTEDGIPIYIYSSGSVTAQKAFFKDTEYGDLTIHLKGFFDTTTGPKKEAESYRRIADQVDISPEQILFASDITDELNAAQEAGMRAILLLRPGNKEQPDASAFETVRDFCELSSKLA